MVYRVHWQSSIQKKTALKRGIVYAKTKPWVQRLLSFTRYPTTRPDYQETEMPGGARKSREKPPYEPEKVKSQSSRGSSKVCVYPSDLAGLANRASRDLLPATIRTKQLLRPLTSQVTTKRAPRHLGRLDCIFDTFCFNLTNTLHLVVPSHPPPVASPRLRTSAVPPSLCLLQGGAQKPRQIPPANPRRL